MTCVPDALLRVLRHELASASVRNRSDLGRFVRDRSQRFEGKVTVNGVRPTEKQAVEVREWLRGFNPNQNGQLVSAFDPLLMLLAETTGVRIVHDWAQRRGQRVRIVYQPLCTGTDKEVRLRSSETHMH